MTLNLVKLPHRAYFSILLHNFLRRTSVSEHIFYFPVTLSDVFLNYFFKFHKKKRKVVERDGKQYRMKKLVSKYLIGDNVSTKVAAAAGSRINVNE